MSISHNKKIILVHIPKTGGQSIHKALRIGKSKKNLFGFQGDKEYSHLTATEIREYIGSTIFDSYLKLAVVRNPFDRLVSEYHFKKKGDHRFINVTNLSFEAFVLELGAHFHRLKDFPQREINHFTPQADFVYDDNDNLLVDKLFKFEDFNTSIDSFIQKITGVQVPHINKTHHTQYSAYYSKKTKNIVEQIYRKDLEKFDYCL